MKQKIPTLKTEKEVNEFWSRHDLTDYEDELDPVAEDVQLDPKLAHRIHERSKKKNPIS